MTDADIERKWRLVNSIINQADLEGKAWAMNELASILPRRSNKEDDEAYSIISRASALLKKSQQEVKDDPEKAFERMRDILAKYDGLTLITSPEREDKIKTLREIYYLLLTVFEDT